MCSRTRENSKNKVKPDLWDTLYIHLNIDGVVVKYHGNAVVGEGVGGVADQEAGLA